MYSGGWITWFAFFVIQQVWVSPWYWPHIGTGHLVFFLQNRPTFATSEHQFLILYRLTRRTCSGQSCLLLSALPEYIPNMAGFDGQSKMILRKSMQNLAFFMIPMIRTSWPNMGPQPVFGVQSVGGGRLVAGVRQTNARSGGNGAAPAGVPTSVGLARKSRLKPVHQQGS